MRGPALQQRCQLATAASTCAVTTSNRARRDERLGAKAELLLSMD
jgi:hypothetical protein